MPELKVERTHSLGLATARDIAERWREQAEAEWGMDCACERGDTEDVMRMARSGVSGSLTVSATRFDLQLKLGFLLGAYADKIEQKIRQNLDELLGPA
jgi:putative polyhydroxyalkanoate system protein